MKIVLMLIGALCAGSLCALIISILNFNCIASGIFGMLFGVLVTLAILISISDLDIK